MSENNNNNINSKDFLIGSLIGGIIGASVALFLAPKSGKELRTELNTQASVVKEKTGQIASTAKEKGSQWTEIAKTKGTELSKNVSEKSTAFVERVKSKNEDESDDELLPELDDQEDITEEEQVSVEGAGDRYIELNRP